MAKVNDGLAQLNKLVERGIEYPEAEWMVSYEFRMTTDELEEMRDLYDKQDGSV